MSRDSAPAEQGVAGPRADLGGAARNGAIALAGSGVAAVTGLLLNVVIGRGFGPAASGEFFVVVAVLTVITTIGKLGADTGLVWAVARARALGRQRDVRTTLRVAVLPSIVAGVLLAVLLFLLAPWLAGLTGGGAEQARLFRQSAPFVLIAGPALVLTAGLRGSGSIFGYTAVQNVIVPGLRPVLAGLTLAAGLGLGAAILTWNLPFVAGLVVAVFLVARRTRAIEQAHPDAAPARPPRDVAAEFWRFSGPRAVTAALEVAIVWADVLVVAALATPRDAGIYAAASRFILTGTLAEGAMRVAMAPEISRLLALRDLDGAARLSSVVTQWTVLLSWPLYLVLALYSPAVLSVFGPGFDDGSNALTLLSVAMLAVMAAGNNQTILLMGGRSGLQMINRAVALSGNLVMNFLLVPAWGMNGAAVAWSVTWVADALLVMLEVRYAIGLKRTWRRVVPAMTMAAVAFVPTGLVYRLLTDGGTVAAVPCAALGVVVFGVLVVTNSRHLDVEPMRGVLPGRGRVGAARSSAGR
ncbi:polysaccharide biosynthesis C-terminal domain-containing protein [Kineosporia sp. J2-2]|uniref:Polysaccharide biosynthesis C-terminal domain-containing protein n=1 Tax=Kineosporia corallincola TaxID=2835133 RepID=A0ABS5TLR1_9ACTN|nr:polysaccharide biosynthesis C-terminal domain-containing protein [Kineosporia corallincola]MBT0770544.1 polysaccharide biosynthesis C-terminal domain-containing protein [Kineosporia corallincola]